jgi:hypothetical protein
VAKSKDTAYEKIFNNMLRKLGMSPCADAIDFLYDRYYSQGRCTRASDARDLLETVQSICRYLKNACPADARPHDRRLGQLHPRIQVTRSA